MTMLPIALILLLVTTCESVARPRKRDTQFVHIQFGDDPPIEYVDRSYDSLAPLGVEMNRIPHRLLEDLDQPEAAGESFTKNMKLKSYSGIAGWQPKEGLRAADTGFRDAMVNAPVIVALPNPVPAALNPQHFQEPLTQGAVLPTSSREASHNSAWSNPVTGQRATPSQTSLHTPMQNYGVTDMVARKLAIGSLFGGAWLDMKKNRQGSFGEPRLLVPTTTKRRPPATFGRCGYVPHHTTRKTTHKTTTPRTTTSTQPSTTHVKSSTVGTTVFWTAPTHKITIRSGGCARETTAKPTRPPVDEFLAAWAIFRHKNLASHRGMMLKNHGVTRRQISRQDVRRKKSAFIPVIPRRELVRSGFLPIVVYARGRHRRDAPSGRVITE